MPNKTATNTRSQSSRPNPQPRTRAEPPRQGSEPPSRGRTMDEARLDQVQLSSEAGETNPTVSARPQMSSLLSSLEENFGQESAASEPSLSDETPAPEGNALQRGIERAAAFGGELLGGAVEFRGRTRGAVLETLGNVIGGAVGEGLQERADFERALHRGAGHALEDTANGFGQVFAHPVETGVGIASFGQDLLTEPGETISRVVDGVVTEFEAQREEGGLGQAFGYSLVQVADIAVGTRGAGTLRGLAGAGIDGANRLLPDSDAFASRLQRAEELTQPLSGLDQSLGQIRERLTLPGRIAEGRATAAAIGEQLDGLGTPMVTPDVVSGLLRTEGIGDVIDAIDGRATELAIPEGARPFLGTDGQPVSGRRDILTALGEQNLSPSDFRRLVNGLLDNGSIDRQAHLLALPEGFEIGRRFDSRADTRAALGLDASGPSGGFWSPANDVLSGSPEAHVRASALPGFNDARRHVTGRLSHPATALLTEIAPRHEYGFNRVGGALQFQAVPGEGPARRFRLDDPTVRLGGALPFHRLGELRTNPVDLFEDFAQEEGEDS